MKKLIFALTILIFSSSCFGPCAGNLPSKKTADVKNKNNQLAAKNFDLESVIALIKQNKVKDMASLERHINAQTSAINNVDMDKDGKVDYIQIREKREGNGIRFDFFALPMKKDAPVEAISIADVTFEYGDTQNKLHLTGTYADNVEGGDRQYRTTVVQQGPSWSQMFFFAWLMQPSRPIYYHPHTYKGYQSRSVYPDQAYSKRRQAYRQNSGIQPVGSTKKRPEIKTQPKKKVWRKPFKRSKGNPFRFGGKRGLGRGFRR